MNYKIIYILLITVAGLMSCNTKIDSFDNVDAMVTDATQSVETINSVDFKAMLESHHNVMIIDCREEKEFIDGHIPGSINIPRGKIEFSKLISDRRSILYVYSMSKERSTLTATSLKKLKYKKVFVIEGGMEKWEKDYPEFIEKGSGNSQNDKPQAEVEESGGCG